MSASSLAADEDGAILDDRVTSRAADQPLTAKARFYLLRLFEDKPLGGWLVSRISLKSSRAPA